MVDDHFYSLQPRALVLGVTERDSVKATEAVIDFALPAALRLILENFAGAVGFDEMVRFKPCRTTEFEDSEGFLGFELFYGLNRDSYSILKNFTLTDVPSLKHLLAIGEGPGGDKVCLSKNDPSLYFWKHDSVITNEIKIAEDFESFINRLEVYEISSNQNLGIDESKTWISL